MRFRLLTFVLGCIALSCFACKKDYTTLKQRELASGIRHDSIFMGIYFGMTRADFYKHCFVMNARGFFTNGPQNTSVLYVFETGYRQPIDLNFYPDFKDDKIYNMKVWFDYQGWAPWNKEYYADQLIPEALIILEKWYGPGFTKQRGPNGKPFWGKVNGNREITLRIQDEQHLQGDITDLSITPPPNPAATARPNVPRPIWEKPVN